MTEENNLLETQETNYQQSKSLTVYLKSFASNKAQFTRVLDDVKVKKDDCEIVAKHLSHIKMTNTGRQNRLISHKQKCFLPTMKRNSMGRRKTSIAATVVLGSW